MKFVEKMFSIRSNKTVYDTFTKNDGITFGSLTEQIRNHSSLLFNSQIVEGVSGSHYYSRLI
jgi:hypothetical protein